MDRLLGRVLNVVRDTSGSSVIQDISSSTSTLYLEDATDFFEKGGSLVLPNGSVVPYSTADMELDRVYLTSPLTMAISDGEFISIFPVVNERWATVEVFGYDDPLTCKVPHHYWPMLKQGARTEDKQEECVIIFDSEDWVIWDIRGTARPSTSSETASPFRIFRYTSEGVGSAGYEGLIFDEHYQGNIYAVKMQVGAVLISSATFTLKKSGASIQSMVVPAGAEFSPLYPMNIDFTSADRFRVTHTTPSGSAPNIVVWVFVKLEVD